MTAPAPMRILVADDEPKIAAFVRQGLQDAGFRAHACHDGDEALHLAATGQFHVIVLDIMMPRRDGLEVLRQLRAHRNPIPVILLSARGSLADRVTGLDLGADDYLAKPFSVVELVARLRAVARRHSGDSLLVLRHGDLELDLGTRGARRGAAVLELTSREFALLEYFLRTPGRVHTRSDLCRQVWGQQAEAGSNLVDVCIQRLRRKLDGERPDSLLQTVRGVGYALRDDA